MYGAMKLSRMCRILCAGGHGQPFSHCICQPKDMCPSFFSTGVVLWALCGLAHPLGVWLLGFLQLLDIVLIGYMESWRGHSSWTFSHLLVSCVRVDKDCQCVGLLGSLLEPCLPALLPCSPGYGHSAALWVCAVGARRVGASGSLHSGSALCREGLGSTMGWPMEGACVLSPPSRISTSCCALPCAVCPA